MSHGASRRSSRSSSPAPGQFVTGRRLVGTIFLVPVVVAAVAAIVVARGDSGAAIGFMLQPTVLLGIVAADAVLFVWRSIAIVDAWWNAGRGVPRSDISILVLAALLAATAAMHVVVGAEVLAVRDTVDAVFASSDDEDDGFGDLAAATSSPFASVAPTTIPAVPGSVAPPSLPPTPAPTPRPGPLADGRLDILLVGADAGPVAGACAPTRSSCSASTRRAASRRSSRSRATW